MSKSKGRSVDQAAERAAFRGKVEAALERAHAASQAAYDGFVETAERTDSGMIADSFGWADVIVIEPSPRLRDTLKAMGQTRRDVPGVWYVSSFPARAPMQSVTAHEVACRAACAILAEDLEGEGNFSFSTRID